MLGYIASQQQKAAQLNIGKSIPIISFDQAYKRFNHGRNKKIETWSFLEFESR